MEFEWNIFPGFNTLQLSEEVKSLLCRLGETPENFTGRILFMSMFKDISCGTKGQWRRMSGKWSTRIFVCKKIRTRDNGHSLVLVLRKKWYSISEGQSHKGIWDKNGRKDVVGIRWERMSNFSCYDSHCPRGPTQKQRDMVNCRYIFAADQETIETIFRIIVSANELSLYGAVRRDLWRVWISSRKNGEDPFVMGQSSSSLVLSVIKTEVPLGLWWPGQPRSSIAAIWRTNWKAVTTRQIEQIFVWMQDFWTLLKLGQYFRTKGTADLSQFHAVVVNALFQEKKKHHNQKAVLEVCNQLLAW